MQNLHLTLEQLITNYLPIHREINSHVLSIKLQDNALIGIPVELLIYNNNLNLLSIENNPINTELESIRVDGMDYPLVSANFIAIENTAQSKLYKTPQYKWLTTQYPFIKQKETHNIENPSGSSTKIQNQSIVGGYKKTNKRQTKNKHNKIKVKTIRRVKSNKL